MTARVFAALRRRRQDPTPNVPPALAPRRCTGSRAPITEQDLVIAGVARCDTCDGAVPVEWIGGRRWTVDHMFPAPEDQPSVVAERGEVSR